MPTKEINLISEKKDVSQQEKYFRQIINRDMPLILAVFIIITGFILGYNIILDKKQAVYEENIVTEKNKISLLDKNEGMYLMLKQKAVAINSIFSKNFPFDSLFQFAKGLESQGGTLLNLDLVETGEMTLSMKVENTAKLDDLINVTVEKAKEAFSKVELSGIVYKPDGSFDINLRIDI